MTICLFDLSRLINVAHSYIGDETSRGVSGGQRKRVNIGLELAAAPLVIFADEPTSGLDSTAALQAINTLKEIAKSGVTVVAVLHQPRIEIFRELDDVILLLPGGRTAYIGPCNEAKPYFESLGFEVGVTVDCLIYFMRSSIRCKILPMFLWTFSPSTRALPRRKSLPGLCCKKSGRRVGSVKKWSVHCSRSHSPPRPNFNLRSPRLNWSVTGPPFCRKFASAITGPLSNSTEELVLLDMKCLW